MVITLNGTEYRLCLLDTNAVSEMVKEPTVLSRFLVWSDAKAPLFIPCFSPFTLLELRRKSQVYNQFIARFGLLPCILLKSHEQLLEEEVRCYPAPTAVDPCMLGFFAGQIESSGNDLAAVLAASFGTDSILAQERQWNDGQQEVVDGIRSLVINYPPAGDTYSSSELRFFLQVAGFSQLVYRAHDFVQEMVRNQIEVDIDRFPSLKASLFTVFYKFYTDRSRRPSRSDTFDVIIAAATPYVDAIVTESHQAEALRKAQKRDDFIRDLRILTLRDFR